MPSELTSGELVASISADLADNNAGLISAQDVRHNMEDTVVSIRKIVASGEGSQNSKFRFYNPIIASRATADTATEMTQPGTVFTSGDFVAESGIIFPNAPVFSTERQVRPWLGDERIDHGNLEASSLTDDDHLIYYNLNGVRPLTGNMKTNGVWINASGTDRTGFKFRPDVDGDATAQTILVSGYTASARRTEPGYSNQGGFEFMDGSTIPNGKGTAKAWINLSTSGTLAPHVDRPEIFAHHNISGVLRLGKGQLAITFTSGTFHDDNYIAIGTANGRTGSTSDASNFEVNTVGIVGRSGVKNGLRECRVYIVDDDGSFQDAHRLDLVFFGVSPNETSAAAPTVGRSTGHV